MINREDCFVLRGLAILCIFVHNYCHLLPNTARENEFYFDVDNDSYFISHIFTSDFVIQLFSYLGHLGVPVFVFLTGYGLAQKYECSPVMVETRCFIWRHYRKFFFPILGGMLSFFVVFWLIYGYLWNDCWHTFIMQITMTGNFALHPNNLIKPGPYWYFGLTMQLYIIYILFVYHRSINLIFMFVAGSIVLLFFVQSKHYSLIWIKYNSLGWLLPYSIGLWVARRKIKLNFKKIQFICAGFISSILIFIFGRNYYLWLLIPLLSVISFICICSFLQKGGLLYNVAFFLGRISLYIFVVHPIVREIIRSAIPLNYRYEGLLLYIIIVVLCSWTISFIPNPLKNIKNLNSIYKRVKS